MINIINKALKTKKVFKVISLVSLIKDGSIECGYSIPQWKDIERSRFIESIILRLPLPPLILIEIYMKDKFIIVDGNERARCISAFLKGDFYLEGLSILSKYNGLTFSELPNKTQYDINQYPIDTYNIRIDSKVFDDYGTSLRSELFRRYNLICHDVYL
jgi:hypothetical protein